MINLELAKKIKELRTNKGFSQEELANETNLSLRTIQRIEGGETATRGDTLKRLAHALAVTPKELAIGIEHEDSRYLTFLNLLALSFIAYPLLGVIAPLTLWMLKRDKIKNLSEMGKRLINFQLTWCLLIGIWYFSMIGIMFFDSDFSIPSFGLRLFGRLSDSPPREIFVIGIPVLLYVYNFFTTIINIMRSYQAKSTFYQPAIRLF